MQFHIPQYIDVEDKLLGPLTLKQGLFLGGGAGAIYLVIRLVPYIFISAPLIIAIAALSGALAFYPKERLGRTFLEILEASFLYLIRDKLYTWKKTTKEPILGKEQEFVSNQILPIPTISKGKLSNVSTSLNMVSSVPKIGGIEKGQQYTAPFVPSVKPVAPVINIIVDRTGAVKTKN